MTLVDFAIRRRVTIAMATVAITLLGFISLSRLKVNLLPDLSYPTLTIRTELPGAAPTEIENLISRPVEEAAGVVRNVRSVRSVSRSGQSDVIIEFTWGTDMDFAGIEVRERLDLLWLPVEATRPLLLRFDPSSEPVMRVAFVDETGSTEDRLKFLRRFADDRIKPEIESVEGSAAVKVSGGFEDEVQIYVDQQRLAQLRLSIEQVARRIGAENVNLSGGRLEQGTQRFLVRTVNEFDTLEDMANSVIAIVDQQPVYLKDVARVERGYKDRTAITRLNGEECIELAIYKEGDANTVQLAHGITDKLESLGKTLPGGTRLVPVYDQSKFIASAVSDVKDAAILGGLLSILVLYFFLRDAWATIVTGVVIPVTVVGIFVMMYAFDLTLNVMSLGGIALSVGMLIDNSVVILEAIARRKEAGLSTIDAAREGTAEVATAVTASTLTSVAVFFPMVFVSGIAGQLFRDQALTVTFAQLISLMVGITLVPMLTAWRARLGEPVDRAPDAGEPRETLAALRRYLRGMLANVNVNALVRPTGTSSAQAPPSWLNAPWRLLRRIARWVAWSLRWLITFLVRQLRLLGGLAGKLLAVLLSPFVWITQKAYNFLERHYPALLDWALERRAAVLFAAFGMLAATALILPRLGSELIPQLSQGEFTVKMRLPAGSPLETTDRQVRYIHEAALKLPNLDSAYAVAGTGNRLDANPVDSGENAGNLDVKLRAPIDQAGEERAMQQMREQLAGIPGAQYEFTPTVVAHALDAGGSDPRRLRSRAPLTGSEHDARSHGALRRVPRHSIEHRRRPSGDPDRVRPGARLAARARGARHRGSRGVERARQRRHPLPAAGKEDRRIGAQRGYARRIHRGSEESRGEPGLGTPGSAVRCCRSAARHRPGRNPPREPGARGGDFRGAGRRRPRQCHARGPGHPGRDHAAGGHPRFGVRPERGNDAELPFAGAGLCPRRVPGLPGDGLTVRIAAASVRDSLHDSNGPDRIGLGAVHHGHHHQFRRVDRPHHVGRYRRQQRDRAHRRHQPGA